MQVGLSLDRLAVGRCETGPWSEATTLSPRASRRRHRSGSRHPARARRAVDVGGRCRGAERRGLDPRFDASEFPVRIASEVKGFEPESVVGAKDARRLERNVVLAVAARGGLGDAGVEGVDPREPASSSARRSAASSESSIRTTCSATGGTRASRRGSSPTSSSIRPADRSRSTSGCAARTTRPVSACATGSHAVGGRGDDLTRRRRRHPRRHEHACTA